MRFLFSPFFFAICLFQLNSVVVLWNHHHFIIFPIMLTVWRICVYSANGKINNFSLSLIQSIWIYKWHHYSVIRNHSVVFKIVYWYVAFALWVSKGFLYFYALKWWGFIFWNNRLSFYQAVNNLENVDYFCFFNKSKFHFCLGLLMQWTWVWSILLSMSAFNKKNWQLKFELKIHVNHRDYRDTRMLLKIWWILK